MKVRIKLFLPQSFITGIFPFIFGGIAQLARVLGSYPIGRRFESHCRYHNYDIKKMSCKKPHYNAVFCVLRSKK